jgi:hypothetical protein
MQTRLIQQHYKSLKSLAMPFAGHPSFQIIKEVMGFRAIQDLIIADDFSPQSLRELHKECRKTSELYAKRVKKDV